MATESKSEMSRRSFLKGTALGVAAIAGTGVLAGCAPKAATTSNVPEKWDKETDVVVVGYGGAGAAAAIGAREAGSEVLILEKAIAGGGSTALCGGVYYAAGTSVQAANGIEDSADKMYDHYMNAGMGFNDPALSRIAADQSAANVEKLISLGATFPTAPTVSGAEYKVGSEPIARVHSVAYGELGGGMAYYAVLRDGAEKAGAEVMLETEAKRLVTDASGQVIGVLATNAGTDMAIKARKGVVIATGGFTRDEKMLRAYNEQAFYCQPLGAPDLTGEGLRMAFALGADAKNIDEVLGVPGLTLPGKIAATYAFWTFGTANALMINTDGRRFVDEYAFYDWKNTELLKQPNRYCFSFFDAATRDAAPGMLVSGFSEDLEQEVADGLVLKADTLADLAAQMGVPAERFEATVAKFNEDAAAGVDSEYGRALFLAPLETAPFYAFKTFPTMFDTMGGLKINENAQVVDVWGDVIPRLYAAPMTAGGVMGEHYPGSGSSLNAGLTFGLIAGKHASGLEAVA
jgi:urocanate reductase